MEDSGHLSFDTIYDYINVIEPENENIEMLLRVGRHINDCPECLRRVRILDGVKSLYDNWDAKTQSEVMNRIAVVRSLMKLSDKVHEPGIKERLTAWMEKFQGKAGLALQLFLNFEEAAGKVTKIIPNPIEKLTVDVPMWNFTCAPSVLSGTRGTNEKKYIENKIVDVSEPGTEIIVDGYRGRIKLKLCGIDGRTVYPLAVLVPVDGSNEAFVANPAYNSELKVWTAEFSNVPDGEYILVFEPM